MIGLVRTQTLRGWEILLRFSWRGWGRVHAQKCLLKRRKSENTWGEKCLSKQWWFLDSDKMYREKMNFNLNFGRGFGEMMQEILEKDRDTRTGTSTNPYKNFDLNKNLNMNLIKIENWNWNWHWNLKLKLEIGTQN